MDVWRALCGGRLFADTARGADYWIINHDGRGIGGLQRATPAAPRPATGTRAYFETDDLEQSLHRVAELGGTVEHTRVALGGDDRWYGAYCIVSEEKIREWYDGWQPLPWFEEHRVGTEVTADDIVSTILQDLSPRGSEEAHPAQRF